MNWTSNSPTNRSYCSRRCGNLPTAKCGPVRTRSTRPASFPGKLSQSGGAWTDRHRRAGGSGRRGIRPYQLCHCHRRAFASLRLHRRDSLGAKFAVLRNHPPAGDRRAKEQVSRAVRAWRAHRLLRADRTPGRLPCRGAAHHSRAAGTTLCGERREGMDHQWRSGRRSAGLRQHRSGAGRKRDQRAFD